MWQKILSLLRSSPQEAQARRSEIIPTWMAPEEWECGGQFDTMRPACVEVLYDEVDRSDGCFEYRLLLYPDDEVSIRFRQVEITERRAANQDAR
jgi:hypothetical protein